MSKKAYTKHVSLKEKKKFSHLLSDHEDIKLLTGYSGIYLRQKFIHHLIIPCVLMVVAALIIIYLYLPNHPENATNPLIILFSSYFLAFLIAALQTYILANSIKYILTNKRVVIKQGYFNHSLCSAPYDKVTQIEVEQGFMDKLIFNHGKIRISIAGLDHKEVDLIYVDAPLELKNILENLIHAEHKISLGK